MSSDKHKAGWIFNLNSEEALKYYIKEGVYSTRIKPPKKNGWSIAYLGTIADYASMQAGELVYFFIKKKIYGVGELVDIGSINSCVFKNLETAFYPKIDDEYINNTPEFYDDSLVFHERNVWDCKIDKDSRFYQQRWVCVFKPYPCFYEGIDMDDILKSDTTHKDLRGLRTFSGVSFMKLSPSENQIFKTYIEAKKLSQFETDMQWQINHEKMANKLDTRHAFNLEPLIATKENADGYVSSEMLIEASLLSSLVHKNKDVCNVFGLWDYISHQVTASPFKPVEYMDKMDICGYKGGDGGFWDAKEFLLIEIKKGSATDADVEQINKYINWLRHEYGAEIEIKAFLVAFDYGHINDISGDINFVIYKSKMGKITFNKGLTPDFK